MKRPVRNPVDGTYTVHGKKYKELFGSREQVMNGTAYKTSGGLTTEDLLMNKNGRIVSSVKFKTAKKERRLEKYGYFAKKGKFGYVKKGKMATKSARLFRKTRKTNAKGGGKLESLKKELKKLIEDEEKRMVGTSTSDAIFEGKKKELEDKIAELEEN